MRGRVVILSGPSGVGKDTLIEAWQALDPRVERVVTVTTRPPRPGERDGVDYRFVSHERFEEMARTGAFLEHKEVHGQRYGTPAAEVERLVREGKIAILKIDVQGALEVMDKLPEATSVFVLPPDWEELERRIRSRGLDSPEAIERRLENARGEVALAERYAHRIVNDDVARAVEALRALVAATGPAVG